MEGDGLRVMGTGWWAFLVGLGGGTVVLRREWDLPNRQERWRLGTKPWVKCLDFLFCTACTEAKTALETLHTSPALQACPWHLSRHGPRLGR